MVVGGVDDPPPVDLYPIGLANVGLSGALDLVHFELAGSLVQGKHPIPRLDLLDRHHSPVDGVDPDVAPETFVLGGHPGQVLALRLRNSELLIGRLD